MKNKYSSLEYNKCDLIVESRISHKSEDRLMFNFKNDDFNKNEFVFISSFDAKELGKDLLKAFGVLDFDLLLKENIELKEFNKQLINDKKNLMERLHSSVNVKTITIAFNDLEDEVKRLKKDLEHKSLRNLI